jgi:hypothetical protein
MVESSQQLERAAGDMMNKRKGYAQGGVADQMNSMLPAADNDTRSTEEYIADTKPMDITSVPFFQRPMDASPNDKPTGRYDETGAVEYRTALGNTYFVRRAEDQRTTRDKIIQDVVPVIKEYLADPKAPTADQAIAAAKAIAGDTWETISIPGDLLTGKKDAADVTMGDVFGTTVKTGAASLAFKVPGGDETLRIFGGPGAKSYSNADLLRAERLREAGASPVQIETETGRVRTGTPKDYLNNKGKTLADISPEYKNLVYIRDHIEALIKQINTENSSSAASEINRYKGELAQINEKIAKFEKANPADESGIVVKPQNPFKFEIDDSNIKIKANDGSQTLSEATKHYPIILRNIIPDHKELFDEYPGLENVEFYVSDAATYAHFDPSVGRNGAIVVNPSLKNELIDPNNERFRDTFFHEIQHAAQFQDFKLTGLEQLAGSPTDYAQIIVRYPNSKVHGPLSENKKLVQLKDELLSIVEKQKGTGALDQTNAGPVYPGQTPDPSKVFGDVKVAKQVARKMRELEAELFKTYMSTASEVEARVAGLRAQKLGKPSSNKIVSEIGEQNRIETIEEYSKGKAESTLNKKKAQAILKLKPMTDEEIMRYAQGGINFARYAEGIDEKLLNFNAFGPMKAKYAEGGLADQTDRMFGRYNAAPIQPQKGMGWGELIVDNILGLDNEYESFGEKLGKTVNEDEVKFLKDTAVGAYEGAKEFVTSPIETTKQVALDIRDSVYRLGAEDLNTRLQRMYGLSYDQATDDQVNQAREAVIGDALTALELIPAAKGATTIAKAGINAIPSGIKADVVGQTKAMLSGDTEFLRGTPTERATTQSLSAGFTGQNPPTYIKRTMSLEDQRKANQGIDVETGEPFNKGPILRNTPEDTKVLLFREPIAEFARTVDIPKKGLLGSQFLNLIKKNESIPESSLQEGIIDPSKRYSREELLSELGEGFLNEETFSSRASLDDNPLYTKYEDFQRQVKDAGFSDVGKELNYFEIPILSSTGGKGKPFQATSQHFNEDTIAHIRGSIVQPKSGGEVPAEYYNLIGNKPFMLVEELQSDLLTKGYVKPFNVEDRAFNKAADQWTGRNLVSFNEIFGDITKEIKSVIKDLEKNNIKNPIVPRSYGEIGEIRGDLGVASGRRGYVVAQDFEDYLTKLSDYASSFDTVEFQAKDFMEYQTRMGRPIFDILTGKEVNFEEFLNNFRNKYKTVGERLVEYKEAITKKLKEKGIDKEVEPTDFQILYENYLDAKSKIDENVSKVGLPPITKNKQAVEEALKVAIAKAAKEGVDKIVIPPAERIAAARDRNLSYDKGDRFYRTYVTDLNKALDDLQKNYPVTVHHFVELPYREGKTLKTNDLNVNNIDLDTLQTALESWAIDEPLTEAQRWHFDNFLFNNDLTEADDLIAIFEDWHLDMAEQIQNERLVDKSQLSSEGTIVDISKLIDEYQVEKPRQFAEGGAVGNMSRQMELFAYGGLNDDGMDRDPVSGNEVPAGSMASEVRDDIPAQLSEGEYVVPADVVRYYGVKFFEDLRQEAKMGLTDMEANGRIGGEPIMQDNGSITQEDLAALDQMLSTGAYNGGLMDKLATVAKTDPMINQRLNRGGVVVGFAGGGAVQSPYNDPTAIDQVINKVMAAAQANPQIMDELAKRGIQVSRTQPQMQPEQMDRANPPEEARRTFALGGLNTSMTEDQQYSYITSPTSINANVYQVPGASYTYANGTAPAPVEGPSKEFCEAKGMMYDAVTQTCVPKPAATTPQQDTGDDRWDNTPASAQPSTPWFDGVNWADPTAIAEFGMSSLSPMDKWASKGMQAAGLMIGGPLGLVAAAAPKVDALMDLSSARAAYLVASAKGDTETATKLKAEIDAYEKNAGFLVNKFGDKEYLADPKAPLVASGTGKFNSFTKSLGLDPDQFDPDTIDKWTDEQRTTYNNAINQKYSRPAEQPKPVQTEPSPGGRNVGDYTPTRTSSDGSARGTGQAGGYTTTTGTGGTQTRTPVAGDTASRGGGFTDTRPDDPRGEGRYGQQSTSSSSTSGLSQAQIQANRNEGASLGYAKGGLMRRRKY